MNINDIKEPETQIAEYSRTAVALADLRGRLADVVYDVATTAGMVAAKRDRAEVRDLRTGLERERVRIKAPALERCRLIDAEAKSITAELEALEKPIDDQIKAEERRKEEEKQAKINAEFGRVEAIQTALHELHMEASVAGKSSEFIATRIEAIKALILDKAVYQEQMPQAQITRQQVLDKLALALAAQQHAEDEAVRIAAERAELAALRAAAAAQKAKDEAAAAALRKAEEDKINAERAAQRAEQARLDAEAQRKREDEDRAAAVARAAAQAAHEAEMKRQREAEAAAREAAANEEAKADERKRKAAAADSKLRAAAPVMLAALRRAADVLTWAAEQNPVFEAARKEAFDAIKEAT